MNIFEKMAAITAEINTVAKNLQVDTGSGKGYKAVSEADVLAAVKPIEEKHKVYSYPFSRNIIESGELITSTKYGERKQLFLRIETVYRFVDTENPADFVDIVTYGDGIDAGDKATGKAMTYGDKYALLKAYKIQTGEDPDKDASEELKEVKSNKITEAEKAVLRSMCEKRGYTAEEVFKNGLDLTAEQYVAAVKRLERLKPKNEG